jgi:glycosyltransferase involved in cell wall biosynthesis
MELIMVKVSVVIPCYNQAHFIDDAIQSLLAQTFKDFEIIIVNDGSTDPQTNSILESYKSSTIKLIHTENQGIASARNNGIKEATGVYILPLDADDKVASSYLEKAIGLLDAYPNLGIVYCQAEYFGEKTGKWELPEYSFPEILLGNMIFCSGFYRKSDWQEVNGYNPNMKYGLADFDFWLSLIELGRGVFRIPEPLFFYRQRSGSMSKSITREQLVYLYTQLFKNHPKLYGENISILFHHIVELREEARHLAGQVREMVEKLDQSRLSTT